MKIITRAELLKCPKGTIYRCIDGLCWDDDWRRFEEATDFNDWYYSVIGPSLSLENDGQAEISGCMQRDALYQTDTTYMVLEEADILAMVRQLTTGISDDFEIVLPLQFTQEGGPLPASSQPITPEALLAQAQAFVNEHWGRFGFGPKLDALKGQNATLYHLVRSLVRNR